MPKKLHKIDRFEGGLVNNYNKRDIPDNSLFNAVDVMTDVFGKIRQMGKDEDHAVFELFLAKSTPGYGIYAFNIDYNYSDFALVSGSSSGSKVILMQDENKFVLYDTEARADVIELSGGQEESDNVIPEYFYADGAIRVCDGNFQTAAGLERNSQNQWFGPIKRNMFKGHDVGELQAMNPQTKGNDGRWIACDQQILPPDGGNAYEKTSPSSDTDFETIATSDVGINISVHDRGTDVGDWEDGIKPKFAYSWLYDGKPGSGFEQESKLFVFGDGSHATNKFGMNAIGSNTSLFMQVQIKYNETNFAPTFGADTTDVTDWFNSFSGQNNNSTRITGFRLYYSGDADVGDFEDPFMMLEGYFGSSEDDHAWIRSSENEVENLNSGSTDPITANFTFESMPTLTYELLNGYKHDVDSIYARYKTACIANGRLYAGNIFQDGRQYRDRMIKSPVFKYDILPSTNYLDVATQDGDIIIKLVTFADRILQFKRETLYIINISGDFEYIEGSYRFMGVSKPYAVAETELGIVWVNRNGCYLYDGNNIENLIDNKIKPNNPDGLTNSGDLEPDNIGGWSDFVSDTGMVGYIPDMKQIVIFENPSNSGVRGDIMVYDMNTKSWTRGIDRVSPRSKSNPITNYDNSCMYGIESPTAEVENFTSSVLNAESMGASGQWTIQNIMDNLTFNNAILKIGSTQISNLLDYDGFGDGTGSGATSLSELIANQIDAGDLEINTAGNNVILTRYAANLGTDSDPYNGSLTLVDSDSGSTYTPTIGPQQLTPVVKTGIECVIKNVTLINDINAENLQYTTYRMLCVKKSSLGEVVDVEYDGGIYEGSGEANEISEALFQQDDFRFGEWFNSGPLNSEDLKAVTVRLKSTTSFTSTSNTIINADSSYIDVPLFRYAWGSSEEPGLYPEHFLRTSVLSEHYSSGLEDGWWGYILSTPTGEDHHSTVPPGSDPNCNFSYCPRANTENADPGIPFTESFEWLSFNEHADAAYGANQGTFISPITITVTAPVLLVWAMGMSGYDDDVGFSSILFRLLTDNLDASLPAVRDTIAFTNTEYTIWQNNANMLAYDEDDMVSGSNGWQHADHYVNDDGGYQTWQRMMNNAQGNLSPTVFENFLTFLTHGNEENEYPYAFGMTFWGASNGGVITSTGISPLTLQDTQLPTLPKKRKLVLHPSRLVSGATSVYGGAIKYNAKLTAEDNLTYENTTIANEDWTEFDILDELHTSFEEDRLGVGGQTPWGSETLPSYTVTIKTFNNSSTIPNDTAINNNKYFLISHIGASSATALSKSDLVEKIPSLATNHPYIAIRLYKSGSPGFDGLKPYKIKGIKESAGANGVGVQVEVLDDADLIPTAMYHTTVENGGSDETIADVTLEIGALEFEGTHPHLYPESQITLTSTTTASTVIRRFKNDSFTANKYESASSYLRIETKDIDFGSPSIEKILYKVELTASFQGDMSIGFATNNQDFLQGNHLYKDGTGLDYITGTGVMTRYNLYFSPNRTALRNGPDGLNIQSVRLKIMPRPGYSLSKININDLSISYREKGIR